MALYHLLEFISILIEDAKRTGSIKPSVFVVLHQFCGFDKIMQNIYWHLKAFEKLDENFFSSEENDLTKKLIKKGLVQVTEK